MQKGELNRIIDSVCHQRARKNSHWWLIDFALHCLVEEDLRKSITKATQYYPRQLFNKLAKDWEEHHS